MKVFFISDVALSNQASGAEKVLYQQAIGLNRRKLDVYAISRINKKADYMRYGTVNGVKIASYGADISSTWKFFYATLRKPNEIINNLCSTGTFQACVCHQPFTYLSLAVTGKLKNIPIIYIFHSPIHEEYLFLKKRRDNSTDFIPSQARKFAERLCLKRAQRIIVLSQYMRKKLKDIHRFGGDRVMVNPGGVDLKQFLPPKNRKQLKQALQLPRGKVHLLTVRNLEPRMGLDNLIKAVGLLKGKEKNANIHLVIGGEGPERSNLESLIRNYGLNDDVIMTGFIPAEQLPKYYGAADFFVLPTRELEGFGLVTPESMACGTPVLGTPVGGTVEILSGFDSQFLFKDATAEAMAEGIMTAVDHWLNDEEKYARLRERCRKYAAENYSWQRHVDQLKSIIDEIVAEKGVLR